MAGSPNKRARREAAGSEAKVQLPAVIPPPPEPRDRFGRRSGKYKPEFVEMARVLCEAGATNAELAAEFGVALSNFHLWRLVHPDFGEVIKSGKRKADERVERSLYEIANGFTVETQEPVKLREADGSERIEYVTKTISVLPDQAAIRYWLNNRDRENWRERSEKHVTGTIEHEHLTLEQTQERVRARLAEIKLRQIGNGQ